MAKFCPNHLRSFELTYEISVRGIVPPTTVQEKRKVLRGILSQEKSERSFMEIVDTYTFEENVKEIRDTLTDIKALLQHIKHESLDDIKRLESRITHSSGRISRLVPESEVEKLIKQELLRDVLILEADLADIQSPPPPIPNYPSGIPNPPSPHPNYPSNCNPLHSSTPTNPNMPQYTGVPVKKVPIYKWGIKKFSGKDNLLSFLELIDSLKSSRGCDNSDLFDSAADLFEGDAWTWWHNNFLKNRFSNWSDLVSKLKSTFLHSCHDEIKLNEIKSRKQLLKESITMFITDMESQFNRLNSPPSEKEIVGIIKNNLLPDYAKALVLQDVDTISDLTSLCKRVEDVFSLNVPLVPKKEFRTYAVSISSNMKCWNCNMTGHVFANCQRPMKRFCYVCGKVNFTKNTCPNCSKNVKRDCNPADVAGPAGVQAKPANKTKNN